MSSSKEIVLIVDDDEAGREILESVFSSEYRIEKACDGIEAVDMLHKYGAADENDGGIALIMLDLHMPREGGMYVMDYLGESGLIDRIPVIITTADTTEACEEEAYSAGASEVVHKPFNRKTVYIRGTNMIKMYGQKREMARLLKEQEERILKQQRELNENNTALIEVLSSIIDTNSIGSGEPTRRVKNVTQILMEEIVDSYGKYGITAEMADTIVDAAALYDIGKIGIPDSILRKPGRLTDEEFEIVKGHTKIGCEIIDKAYKNKESCLYKYSYEICRHHHERVDGTGYPDRLIGDAVPIYVQAVALADVYCALIRQTPYKPAYPRDKAYEMIVSLKGKQFSNDIIDCFEACRDKIYSIKAEV